MASLSVRGLTKSYRPPARILDDVSFELAEGECLAVLGASGSGKTTLLRCIAGLEDPTAGEILIGDRPVSRLAPADRDVAMVFQDLALYPHLTVRENLAFPLRMRRMRPAAASERIAAVARRLTLTDLLDTVPERLSAGERQRAALGRALVRDPALFLLDEPLTHLDPIIRAQLRAEFAALRGSLGVTTIYVTHDPGEALTLGDRVLVLDGGRIQQLATPAEVHDRPASTLVARLVGSPGMNLLRGTLRLPPAPEGGVQAGVRPEDLALVPVDSGAGNAEVLGVERLGSETLVHLRLPDQGVVIARVRGLGEFRRGDRVGLGIDPESVHWFDAGGRRVRGA